MNNHLLQMNTATNEHFQQLRMQCYNTDLICNVKIDFAHVIQNVIKLQQGNMLITTNVDVLQMNTNIYNL